MFGMKVKDLALVAFAGGMLAIEVVGLQAAAPAALRSLAGLTGMPVVRTAARTARAATQTMVNGFTSAAAEAAVAGIESVVPGGMPGTIQGAAERVAAVTPIRVARIAPHPRTRCSYSYSYTMVVRGARGAAPAADARLMAFDSQACRAEVRAILSARRAERAQERARRAEAVHQAITTAIEASSL